MTIISRKEGVTQPPEGIDCSNIERQKQKREFAPKDIHKK